MIGGAGLGKRYKVTPNDVEVHSGNRDAWEYLQRLMNGESLRLLLLGECGVGKTHMVAATVNDIERKWPQGVYQYWTLPRFAAARRESIQGDREDPVGVCIRAHVVVFDDLGAEQDTEWGMAGLYDVLEERARDMRPTVLISNVAWEELLQRYGDRTVNRLIGSDGRLVYVKGANYRVKQTKGELRTEKWTTALRDEEHGLGPA